MYKIEEIQKLANENLIIKNIIKDKKYKCHYVCKQCGYESYMDIYTLKKGSNCPCCCFPPRIVSEKINSIVAKKETLWMVDYFEGGYDEAKLYTPNSSKKVRFICPKCGAKQNKSLKIANLKNRGLSCECCGQTKSLPERVMISVLNELNMDFIYQLSKTHFDWCGNKKYDFFLPSLNLIIETHGGQHFKDTTYGKLEDIKRNDDYKQELAIKNNIEHYIVIDCRHSDINFIIENILDSPLSTILDLERICWENVLKTVDDDLILKIWEAWNEKPYEPFSIIAKSLNTTPSIVSRSIKVGAKFGRVEYNREVHKNMEKERKSERIKEVAQKRGKKVIVFKDGERVGEFETLSSLEKKSEHLFNTKLSHSKVSIASRNGKKYKGFTFQRV